jgi:catechol 2,3-dioxygenase-like lactoylglutathione lyase family enzyme
MPFDPATITQRNRPNGMPFRIGKIGHVVLHVTDMARSVDFYVNVLGMDVSDVYGEEMMPGGMVFLRFNPDHHGIALISGMDGPSRNIDLNHVAFEVGTLDEVFRARDHLRAAGAKIDFDGRRRAGCQFAVEFRDPDNHRLEIYSGIDQVGAPGEARPRDQWKGAPSLEAAVADPVEGQDATVFDKSLLKSG